MKIHHRRNLVRLACFCATVLCVTSPDFVACADDSRGPIFRAGAFAMDISPTEFPVLVNGGMYSRTANKVVDPLHARCLVLDDGTTRIAIVVVDSCMVPRDLLDDAKELAGKATGIPVERMLISSTHTHQAPSVHGCLGTGVDKRYAAQLPVLIAKGIQLADKKLQPARIGWAVAKEPNNVFCRRWLMKEGTAGTNPFSGKRNDRAQMNPGHSNTNKIRRLGPVDDDVTVLSVQARDGRPLALLGNYSTHYAGGPAVSADYFAVFAERVGALIGAGQRAGPPFVGIMSNGTSGDANCYDFTQTTGRRFDRFSVADDVAKAAYAAYKSIRYYNWVPLAMAEELLTLKVRMPTDKEAAVAGEFLETPEGKKLRSISAVYARETVLLKKMPATRELRLQALRIGSLGITAIPNEVYGITGLKLKKDSPLKPTFNISLANGCEGYIPPPDHHQLGGYTTWRARTSCLEEEAEPKIRKTLVGLLTKVTAARGDARAVPSQPPEVPSPVNPDESLKWLFPKPGLKVELVAAEPLVHDPVAFDWGPDGKLWVAEMLDYPTGLDAKGKPGGRIRFLEDTDGDGSYDKSTVLLDGVAFPTSVMAWKDGVLVTAAPHIFFAADRNDDGVADEIKVLFAGFHEGNQQLRVNCLRWGLDNWVYCASGSHHAGYGSNKIKSMLIGKTTDLGSRDFRFLPDEGLLDPQSGPSQFGRNRDAWGNWFGVQNANPAWHYVLADRYLRRNPHFIPPDSKHRISDVPGSRPVFARSRGGRFFHASQVGHFTSANSAIIYRDELLGKRFAGNSFVSEPVHNLIHREVVSPAGVTFTSRRAEDELDREFLASADTWFRPTMLRTGPDGALWIADMYREIIEHPQWVKGDLKSIVDTRNGHDRGRIYRVYPSDKKPRPIPRLDKLKTEQLAAELESPSGSRRDMVHRFVVNQKLAEIAPLLVKIAANSRLAEARMQALCVLDGLGKLQPPQIGRGLSDKHPGVRRQAVRLCEHRFEHLDLSTKEQLAALVNDPNPTVRLQLAYTLGEWDSDRAARLLGKLIGRDRNNPFVMAAAFSSLDAENVSTALDGLLKYAFERISRNQWPATDGRIIGRLLAMLATLGQQSEFVKHLDPLAQTALNPAMMYALAELFDDLRRQKTSLASVLEKAGADGIIHANIRQFFTIAQETIRAVNAGVETRAAAVRFLGRDPQIDLEALQLLGALLTPRIDPQLHAAALESLERTGKPRVGELLLVGWGSHSPRLRGEILNIVLRRAEWTESLLEALENDTVKLADISASHRAMLLKSKNAAIRKTAGRVLATSVDADRQKVISQFQSAAKLTGSAVRGATVFKKRCATCHQLRGQGTEVGADLAALTDKSPENLLTAILDPNRSVEPRFLSYSAVTGDGRTFSGMLVAETGGSITLLATDGKRHELLRSELDELVGSGQSLMPEGLEKDLSPQDLADLFTLIRGDGKPQ